MNIKYERRITLWWSWTNGTTHTKAIFSLSIIFNIMVNEDGKLFYCSLKFSTYIIHYKFPDWRGMAWTSSRFYSRSLWFPGTHSHHFRSKTCQCIFSLLFTICSLAKKSIVTIIFKLKIQRTQHPEMFVYSENLSLHVAVILRL